MALPPDFGNLRSLIDHFESRKTRAFTRLAASDDHPRWHFAVIGLAPTRERYCMGDLAELRLVEEPPGEVELARALKEKTALSAIGRYSHLVRHELSVDANCGPDKQGPFNFAWWFFSALRIKTLADVLVPAVSSHSWSTISAVPDGECNVQLLEDVPRARRFAAEPDLTERDLDWVVEYIPSLAKLLEVQRYRLAVDCLTTHQHEASLRMTSASLWSGIEALLGVNSELRFRIAALVAAYLNSPGEARINTYKRLKSLYDVRSKAVHGGALSDRQLAEHAEEVRIVLSKLLCKMIEVGEVATEEDFESALLG